MMSSFVNSTKAAALIDAVAIVLNCQYALRVVLNGSVVWERKATDFYFRVYPTSVFLTPANGNSSYVHVVSNSDWTIV